MAKILSIISVAEWQALWESVKAQDARNLLIFKLSPVCPISHLAERNFRDFVGRLPENPSLGIYTVDVISARPVSQRIAADTGVHHESPQALLIHAGGEIAWHASHGDVNGATLKQNVG